MKTILYKYHLYLIMEEENTGKKSFDGIYYFSSNIIGKYHTLEEAREDIKRYSEEIKKLKPFANYETVGVEIREILYSPYRDGEISVIRPVESYKLEDI